MGLDSVELILAVEEEFGLEIPDAQAELLTTPGLVLDYIVKKRNFRDASGRKEGEEAIWASLRQLVASQLGVDPSAVTKNVRFVEDLGVD